MKLIVGLGNPGKEYENTRHNIGFSYIDRIAKANNFPEFREKFEGAVSEKIIDGEKIILLKPMTYMNLSGNSVGQIVKFYKIEMEDIAIIYDDMDMPLSQLRLKSNGSAGGHNGIKSIISHIGENFLRVKCGIGRAKNKEDNINFVLGKFNENEKILVDELGERIEKLFEDIINGTQIEKMMQKYNKKIK